MLVEESPMYAIEFRAKVKNGTIEIPSQYRDRLTDEVKVIVLAETKEWTGDLIDRLLEKPLQVQGFKPLSRDDIYAHR
jgi:hypothetical protein